MLALPCLTSDLPGTGGRIRVRDDDFTVRELPLYEPCGEGAHVYLRIRKQGLTTHKAVDMLAHRLGVSSRDMGYAGLKDAHAVSEQTVSVELNELPDIDDLTDERLQVLWARRHGNKLKPGHLRGNAFEIRVRDVADDAAARAQAVMQVLAKRGLPNGYGEQRFGNRGDTDKVGAALIRRDADAALKHLLGNADDTLDDETHEARACFDAGDYGGALDRWPPRDRDARSILQALIQGKPPHIALRRLSRRMRVFYVSAFQSRLFNQVLTQRLEADTLDRLETGDLAWLHDRGAVFLVDDPDVEQPRADRFEISPSGPIWGHKVRIAREEPGRREYAVLAAEHLTPRDFRSRDATRAPGARRPLRVPIGDWQVEANEGALVLRFALPSGSYATMLLREVMKA